MKALGKNNRASRLKHAIQLDNTFEDRVQAYMKKFTEGSINHMLAQFTPVPCHDRLEDKFEYFYKALDYTCNTSKFISYEATLENPFLAYVELLKEEHFIETYLKSLGLHPPASNS